MFVYLKCQKKNAKGMFYVFMLDIVSFGWHKGLMTSTINSWQAILVLICILDSLGPTCAEFACSLNVGFL